MKYGSADIAFFYIDGYDPTDVSTEFDVEVNAATEEITPFGGDWTTHEFVGVKSFEIKQAGFFDDAANSINAALAAHIGTERILCFAVDDAIGARVIAFAGALQATYNILGSLKGLHRANASYAGNGAVDKCRLLTAATVTANTPGASLDNGAATTDGGIAYLQVPVVNLDGGVKVVVNIEDSANDLDFASIGTFANVTVRTAEALALAGNIRRYVRMVLEFDGGGAAKTITFAVAIRRY